MKEELEDPPASFAGRDVPALLVQLDLIHRLLRSGLGLGLRRWLCALLLTAHLCTISYTQDSCRTYFFQGNAHKNTKPRGYTPSNNTCQTRLSCMWKSSKNNSCGPKEANSLSSLSFMLATVVKEKKLHKTNAMREEAAPDEMYSTSARSPPL